MKKQKQTTIAVEPTLSDKINDHPALEWVTQNGKNILWILLIVVALSFFAYRTFNSWYAKSGQNYLAAEAAYLEMRSTSGERSADAANRLASLLVEQPDLQPKYDGLLSQFLLIKGNVGEAAPIARRALSRTHEENSPFFQQFADATLLIEANEYSKALTSASKLQELIVSDSEVAQSTLLPLNLLRIAMLQQKLDLPEGEVNSWQQWKDLAKEDGKVVHFEKVAQIYSEGEIDLDSYISHRLNVLK